LALAWRADLVQILPAASNETQMRRPKHRRSNSGAQPPPGAEHKIRNDDIQERVGSRLASIGQQQVGAKFRRTSDFLQGRS
jgi:hypothetical protein